MPWYASPAVTGNDTPTDNFSWNNVPTGGSGFKNGGPSPAGGPGNSPSPVLRAPLDRRSAAPDGPAPISAQGAALLSPYFPEQAPAFGDRSKNASGTSSPDTPLRRLSSAFPGMTLPDPDQPVPPQPGRPLGIFTGKPMPSWTVPPPLGGLRNNSSASGNGDLVDFLTGLLPRNPPQPEPARQTADNIPERRLGRRTYSVSPASVFDTGAPAVPLAPSADANYPGGLLGMLAAPAGSDPNQPAPLGDEQEQADLQALEAKFSSSGSINDAWALYKARLASRG